MRHREPGLDPSYEATCGGAGGLAFCEESGACPAAGASPILRRDEEKAQRYEKMRASGRLNPDQSLMDQMFGEDVQVWDDK